MVGNLAGAEQRVDLRRRLQQSYFITSHAI
jgi:hypothetical protein